MINICLKVLCMIIERENKNEEVVEENKPCYDWEPEDFTHHKDAIIKR